MSNTPETTFTDSHRVRCDGAGDIRAAAGYSAAALGHPRVWLEIDQKGYAEDRRPNANMDPYVVTQLILETVCGQSSPTKSAGKKQGNKGAKASTKKKTKKK